MVGHLIDSEDFVIVVDKWDASFLRRPGCKPTYFFLTHLHADHIKGLTSTWSRIIYTSPFNAWLLPMRRNVKGMLLKDLELNLTHTIRKANNDIAFKVTLLDANHCPGAVMFLFQGKFGNILYTGDFRYSPRMLSYPVLGSIIRNKELSVLYLDNTYAASSCKFPSRDDALKEVLKIVDEHPDCKILIGMRQLGKEEVLRAIAFHVNEKVCVSSQRLQILSKLEYEDVFTTDPSQSRIHAVELHTITQRHTQEGSKVVSIKLTSMYECCNSEKQRGNIYVVPYSDHSSHTELMEFVDHFRPLKLYPIFQPQVPKMGGDSGVWYRMSTVNCVIPEEILQLCGPSTDGGVSTPNESLTFNGSPAKIKFHPAPKLPTTIEKETSTTYFDEGTDLVPAFSLGSQLTNNNKARKHIKATWTRLAPKLLSQKGIKFEDSPEKSCDSSQESPRLMSNLEHHKTVCEPSPREERVSDNEGSLMDVPISDGEDDLDTLTSASDLDRQMQLPSNNRSVNGIVGEDRKSECSSERTGASFKTDIVEDTVVSIRRTRSREKLESQPQPSSEKVSNGSNSDVASSSRTTRSKGSLHSTSVANTPATRPLLASPKEGQLNIIVVDRDEIITRSSLKGSPSSKNVCKSSKSSPTPCKNGPRRSISLENLSVKVTRRSPAKESSGISGRDATNCLSNKVSPAKTSTKNTQEADNMKLNQEESGAPNNSVSEADIQEYRTSDFVPDIKAEVDDSISADCSDMFDESPYISTDNKKQASTNGSIPVSSYNGFSINTAGRKRLPVSCDWNSAQEIVKKETEQALKALETLNQMKGFKTRNTEKRSAATALRRLSADNIPLKSPVKSQSIIVLPASPSGLRKRTASILSSMASTFSKPQSKLSSSPRSSAANSPNKPSTSKSKSIPSPSASTACVGRKANLSKANQPTSSSTAITSTQSTPTKVSQSSSTSVTSGVMKATKPTLTPHSSPCKVDQLTSSSTVKAVSDPFSSKSTPSSLSSSLSVIPPTESPKIAPVEKVKRTSPRGGNQVGHEKNKMSSPKEIPNSGCVKEQLKERSKEAVAGVHLSPTSKVAKLAQLPCSELKSQLRALDGQIDTCSKDNTGASPTAPLISTDDSQKSLDSLNQGLFLTDETLASSSGQKKTVPKASRKSAYKKQHDVNVELMKLKMGFAMTKKVKRLSLPSRLSLKRDSSKKQESSPPRNKHKLVQDWKKKISLNLRKSPQRRYRFKSPNKLRENAKRTLASILRSGKSFSNSQEYHADVEDCIEPSQNSSQVANEIEDNSGYNADVESCTLTDKELVSQTLQNSPLMEVDTSADIVLSGNSMLKDTKLGVLNEVRRSSRLLRDDILCLKGISPLESRGKGLKRTSMQPSTRVLNTGLSPVKNLRDNSGSTSSQEVTTSGLSPIEKVTDKSATDTVAQTSPSRFSNRILQRTRNILRKSTDTAIGQQESPNILSLMADAFKKTVPSPKTSQTAEILSSMAQKFKKLDEGAQVSPSVSIQLIPTKPQTPHLRGETSDWGVQITRVESASKKSVGVASTSLVDNLPQIPKSLSIEIIPEGAPPESGPRKGPSPPTVTISTEVIDLSSDYPECQSSQSTISSLPPSPGPRRMPQGATRWPQMVKSEVQSPPQAVWKEKRGSAQSGVIIDIQTQENPQTVAHCPKHCTCGTASKGTCMGTMRNLIETDADCLYEVPLSPEDFEDSGAMLALGKGWIESCFEGPEDRDEFFQSYEDILPTINNSIRQKQSKSEPTRGSMCSKSNRPHQSHVRQMFSSPKQSAANVRPTQNLTKKPTATVSGGRVQSRDMSLLKKPSAQPRKPQILASETRRQTSINPSGSQATKQMLKQTLNPKKRTSTDCEASSSKKELVGKTLPRRRPSSQSCCSSSSVPNSKSSKPSPPPLPSPALKRSTIGEDIKKELKKGDSTSEKKEDKEDQKLKQESISVQKRKTKSASDSPESKKPRANELARLTADVGKGNANQRYRLTVRRSLDHLMTRQKLRSDRRIKITSSYC